MSKQTGRFASKSTIWVESQSVGDQYHLLVKKVNNLCAELARFAVCLRQLEYL